MRIGKTLFSYTGFTKKIYLNENFTSYLPDNNSSTKEFILLPVCVLSAAIQCDLTCGRRVPSHNETHLLHPHRLLHLSYSPACGHPNNRLAQGKGK